MKNLLFFILITFLFCSNSYGQDDMRNYPPEQLTNMEYEAGRRLISEIVSDNDLVEALSRNAYAGYFSGRAWVVVKKGEFFYDIYKGERGGELEIHATYDLSNKTLNSLFEWVEYKGDITYNIRDSDVVYHPFYYYFILFDENHNVKMEFNISTMSASKKAQKARKLRKTLPFTKDQQMLIWELSGLL